MKHPIIWFIVTICAFLSACGGGVNNNQQAMENGTAVAAPASTPVLSEEPPAAKPILRVEPEPDRRKCSLVEEEDGARMLISYESDWFFYVTPSAQVECSYVSGGATVADGLLSITIKALIPSPDSGADIEAQLRERAVRQLSAELNEKNGLHTPAKFDAIRIGKSKRPALCIDAAVETNDGPGRLVACVTSKKNASDEIVIHRAVWVGSPGDYDDKATFGKIKDAAAGWFLYSDTDGSGRILRRW